MSTTTITTLVIGGTLAIVVLLNIGIIAGLRNKKGGAPSRYRALGNLFDAIRNPRQAEDQQIAELAELVKDYKEQQAEKEREENGESK